MLLELAIGDAYGAGFEYSNFRPPRDPADMRYVQHPTHRGGRCHRCELRMRRMRLNRLVNPPVVRRHPWRRRTTPHVLPYRP